jgi:hypothetical protein
MPKRLYPESMIGEARKAERIAAWEPDPTAKHTWYKVARTWRALAERAWSEVALQPARAQRVRGAQWRI